MYFQEPLGETHVRTREAEEAQFEHDLTEAIGRLRAFARRLARDGDQAEDLVQETCAKALANRHQFAAGTNQRAWMFQILKNTFLSQLRKGKWEVPEDATDESSTAGGLVGQEAHLRLREIQESLMKLPRGQRRAILLVGVHGYSYEEAAEACDCAVGTVKSRVSRARSSLERDGQPSAGAAD
ncbi:MAG: sigma-70 family RNA polymerase sigma factor [Alphaproteobacteria bacterium]